MSGVPHNIRKPQDGAPYASLRSADAARASGAQAEAAPPNELQTEAERLRLLREALWAAFDAGPSAGLPNALIDLTMAYTGSLRLQLTLKGLGTGRAAAKAKITQPRRVTSPETHSG